MLVRRLAPCSLAAGLALMLGWPAAGAAQGAGRISERLRGREIARTSPPLDHPERLPAGSATHMRDGDPVLGVVVEGRALAYPWWVLKNHHVVNDTIGRTALAVALCEQCTGMAAFRRAVGGRVLTLEVAGVYNGTILLRDRETRTLWAPFSGRALEGPLAPEKLERIPVAFTTWEDWRTGHPQTEVIVRSEKDRTGHGSWYAPGKWGIVSEMGETISAWDARLPENVVVYGVAVSGGVKSYPLSAVLARGGLVNDEVAGAPVVVLVGAAYGAVGFERMLKDRSLTFSTASEPRAVMADGETGSLWNAEGEAVAGPLRGERLRLLDGYVVEWHVWSAYNPAAEIFGKTELAPPPGHPQKTQFPSLSLAPVKGGSSSALSLPGELNLVVLWAAWCPPCREEMPQIQALTEKHANRGLRTVGIAAHIPEDMERKVVQSFLARGKITFPNFLVDDETYDRLEALSQALGRPGVVLPTVFLTDQKAGVLAVLQGKEVDGLRGAVDDALRGRDAR
jgi:thiol-disulfide isomerase/thioredoxin